MNDNFVPLYDQKPRPILSKEAGVKLRNFLYCQGFLVFLLLTFWVFWGFIEQQARKPSPGMSRTIDEDPGRYCETCEHRRHLKAVEAYEQRHPEVMR